MKCRDERRGVYVNLVVSTNFVLLVCLFLPSQGILSFFVKVQSDPFLKFVNL